MTTANQRKEKQNLAISLSLLRDEITGNVANAMTKLSPRYSMTWVYRSPKTGVLFPRSRRTSRTQFVRSLKHVYKFKGRHYDIRNVACTRNVVMIEMVESYPDPNNTKRYRTPLVLVLEFEKGKVKRGRHYCDPRLSRMHLSQRTIEKAFA
jgi:ketosteroid isomerase-like protein